MTTPYVTTKLLVATVVVPCLLAGALAVLAQAQAPQPDEEALNAMKRQEAVEAAARKKQSVRDFPQGTAARLKDLAAADVARMEIFALIRGDRERPAKRHAGGPLEEEQVAAVLVLFGAAEPARPRGDRRPPPMTPTLVVEPAAGKGDPFEIHYYADLDEPIGGVDSRPLKEALWGLSHSCRCSLIHVRDGQVVDTWVERDAPPIGQSVAGRGLSINTELDPQGRIILRLRLGPAEDPAVDAALPVNYGRAVAFPHREGGHVVALLDWR